MVGGMDSDVVLPKMNRAERSGRVGETSQKLRRKQCTRDG
jgi:hypothetical protein